MRARTGGILAATLAALVATPLAAAAGEADDVPVWGFDLGLHYGYFDRDGRLSSRAPGSAEGEDALQLDGTLAGGHARLRFPVELAAGQPFLQLSGEFDASDAEDRAGISGMPGATEHSSVSLSYQAGAAIDAGLEWETPPLLPRRPLRVRPYAGVGLAWWDAHLDSDRRALGGGLARDNDDFTTVDGRLGLELGLPLAYAGLAGGLDLLVGARLDVPLGDGEEDLDTLGGPGGATPVPGEIDLDEAWATYVGLEWRFHAAP